MQSALISLKQNLPLLTKYYLLLIVFLTTLINISHCWTNLPSSEPQQSSTRNLKTHHRHQYFHGFHFDDSFDYAGTQIDFDEATALNINSAVPFVLNNGLCASSASELKYHKTNVLCEQDVIISTYPSILSTSSLIEVSEWQKPVIVKDNMIPNTMSTSSCTPSKLNWPIIAQEGDSIERRMTCFFNRVTNSCD